MSEEYFEEEQIEVNKEFVIKLQELARSYKNHPKQAARQYSFARSIYQSWIHSKEPNENK